MTVDTINYGALIDEAMHIIVKKALKIAAAQNLPGDHHFFISFLTRYKNVVISEKLLNKYPTEMTIVLQYQFEDLIVEEDYLSVVLSFDGVKEKLIIPFSALTAFADPSVKFALQFRSSLEEVAQEEAPSAEVKQLSSKKRNSKKLNSEILSEEKPSENNNVIALDSFRKKDTPTK